jgi:hypothetical protein
MRIFLSRIAQKLTRMRSAQPEFPSFQQRRAAVKHEIIEFAFRTCPPPRRDVPIDWIRIGALLTAMDRIFSRYGFVVEPSRRGELLRLLYAPPGGGGDGDRSVAAGDFGMIVDATARFQRPAA